MWLKGAILTDFFNSCPWDEKREPAPTLYKIAHLIKDSWNWVAETMTEWSQ